MTFYLSVNTRPNDDFWGDHTAYKHVAEFESSAKVWTRDAWKEAATYFRGVYPEIMALFGNGRIAIVAEVK